MGILKGVEVLDQPVATGELGRSALVAEQLAKGRQRHRGKRAAAGLATKATRGVTVSTVMAGSGLGDATRRRAYPSSWHRPPASAMPARDARAASRGPTGER